MDRMDDILVQLEEKNKTMKAAVDFQRGYIDINGARKYEVCYLDDFKDGVLPDKTRLFEGKEVPIESAEGHLFNSVWLDDQQVTGVEKITSDLIRSLGLGQLKSVFISDDTPAHEVIEFVRNNELDIENFNLAGTAPEHRDTLADLVYSDKFFRKVSVNYTSCLEVSPEYTPKNLKVDDCCITLFKLILHYSHWFNINHLMAFNAGAIVLYNSTLSSADLNKYLTLWKEGNYTQLTFLSITLADGHQFNIQEIIAGLADPITIRTEEDKEIIELNRNDEIGELTINHAKNELTFYDVEN